MAAPQQGGNQQDNSFNMLWGIAGIFAVAGVIWWAFKVPIIQFYLLIKLYQVDFLGMFFHQAYFESLHEIILKARANPNQITLNWLLLLGSTVGSWLRIPFAGLLFVLGIWVYFANSTRTFKNIYNMKMFAKLEKQNWPQITPVIHLDLIKADIDSGPWAMAMNPMQFCKRHQLLDEVPVERVEGMHRKDWDRMDVILRRGKANKLFVLQLGALWRGVDHLTPQARALFGVFAARIAADSKPAAEALAKMAASSSGKLDFSAGHALMKKHLNNKIVQQTINEHAYELTVLAAMLMAARQDGVQASADFLWLKPLDRRLWYILNCVGRQTPFAEVAGIFAHWIAERDAGRKLLVPMVDEATKALEVALKEVIYRKDEA